MSAIAGAAGINNQGAWNAANTYTGNDAVSFANSSWLSLIPDNTTQTIQQQLQDVAAARRWDQQSRDVERIQQLRRE